MKTTILPPETAVTPATATPVARDSHSPKAQALSNWIPRPWSDEIMGCIFLPRMLQKGRQVLASRRQGRDLMNGFLFGDFDYADRGMLKFLRTKEVRVLALLRESDDDAVVARTLIRESGRSAAEIRRWNKRFRTINALFTRMWDADEGRRAPGLRTSLLKLTYNYGLMPPVYLFFSIAQKLTASSHDQNS